MLHEKYKYPESEIIDRIVGSSVAHNNYFVNHPSEMYFSARQDVLTTLSEQIVTYHKLTRGTPKGFYKRDTTYMTLVQWMKSDEFAKHTGSKYAFRQPYVVGSSYSPLRTDDSAVDIVVGVKLAKGEQLKALPQDAIDAFLKAFCLRFAEDVNDEVLLKDNVLFFCGSDDFRVSIRLTINPNPTFAVRLTAALKVYDDFFDITIPTLFTLQNWRYCVLSNSEVSQRLSVPNAHTLTCLYIHFLQYYEFIPKLFIETDTSKGTFLIPFKYEDVVRFKLPAYHPSLLHAYQEFDEMRTIRKPTAGELLLMFFFHYGYLVDLPNTQLIVSTSTFHKKPNASCIGLVLFDDDGLVDTEIPDAYRLQFLMRSAYQLIKDAENPNMVFTLLMRMTVDEAFTAMRDRIMRENPAHAETLDKALAIFDYDPEVVQEDLGTCDGIKVTQVGKTREYLRVSEDPHKDTKSRQPTLAFSEDQHALKGFLMKPRELEVDTNDASLSHFTTRADRMFMTVTFQNPNNLSQLNVIFLPPVDPKFRLPLIEDSFMETYKYQNDHFSIRESFGETVKLFARREITIVQSLKYDVLRHLPNQNASSSGPKALGLDLIATLKDQWLEAGLPPQIFTWGMAPGKAPLRTWEDLSRVSSQETQKGSDSKPSSLSKNSAEKSRTTQKRVTRGHNASAGYTPTIRDKILDFNLADIKKRIQTYRTNYFELMASRCHLDLKYLGLDD